MKFFRSKIKTKAKIYKIVDLWLFKLLIFVVYLICLVSISITILAVLDIAALSKKEFLVFSFLGLFFFVLISLHIYYKGEIKKPRIKYDLTTAYEYFKKGKKINLADYLTCEAYLALYKAIKTNQLKLPFIDNKSLLLAFLENKKAQHILPRFGIKMRDFVLGLGKYYSKGRVYKDNETQNLEKFIEKAARLAVEEIHARIEIGDLLAILFLSDYYIGKVLFNLNLKPEDVINITYWMSILEQEKELKKFNPDHLKLYGGIGRDWGSGYTLFLSRLASDLTEAVMKFRYPLHLIGHSREIKELGKILIRATHHNVLLIGEPGVGKKTIILGLSKLISQGLAPGILRHRHIMEINLDMVLAGAQTPGEIIERLSGVFDDAVRAGNIILFIDRLEALFGGGYSEIGAVDASQVIIPYLENPDLYFIATTNLSDFHQNIETKPGVVDKFERIEVKEPDKATTLRVLQDIAPTIESRTGVIFSYEALKSIIDLADQYIYNKFFPEKAVDLLDEVAVYVRQSGFGVLVLPQHVEEVMRSKTQAPIGEAKGREREKLLHLEEFLHKRVIGQNEAVGEISNAMRRARAGVGVGKKPIGSFLFLGPTGVGKTETCKALSEAYFGNESAMIRFDMSEFQDVTGLYRFIGPPPGSPGAETGGELTNAVKEKPFSLILFDEIEKAYPDILNLFLQMLDEGWLTDSLGRKVKFNNAIIISTSNAGAQLIQECVKQNVSFENMKKTLWDYLIQEGIFRPEFLNRFNAVITFKPLASQEVVQITNLLIKKLSQKLEEEKGIFLEVDTKAIIKLARLGFDPLLGARPIQRVIEKKVEDILAKKMLTGEVGRGSRVVVREEDIE